MAISRWGAALNIEHSKNGSTLTQALVLLPVLALLVTVLFAFSGDAKQQLQAAACLNNMHQWSLGFMMYADDYKDYFPYGGDNFGVCDPADNWAWYNIIPPYLGQRTLCDLYLSGTPPTPRMKGIWMCPSATNLTVQPTDSNPFFMYAINVCTHQSGVTHNIFRRNRMTSPTNTFLFCEEPEDPFSEASGRYDTVTRHFGGSNFVFGDGHADWLTFSDFCRQQNPGCRSVVQWNNSGISPTGDWNSSVRYHWWPFPGAATSSQ